MAALWTGTLVLIGALDGGWMLAGRLHVPQAVGLDPMALGPVFVVLGALWLALAALVATVTLPALSLALPAVLTLWYLPVGTFLSAAALIILALR